MIKRACTTALVATMILIGSTPGLEAQVASRPLPSRSGELMRPISQWSLQMPADPVQPRIRVAARNHTETGLLVGAAVGVAATTIFLIGFCGGADTECGIDEVGRAALIIAVPATALGALIGSLVRTEQ